MFTNTQRSDCVECRTAPSGC